MTAAPFEGGGMLVCSSGSTPAATATRSLAVIAGSAVFPTAVQRLIAARTRRPDVLRQAYKDASRSAQPSTSRIEAHGAGTILGATQSRPRRWARWW